MKKEATTLEQIQEIEKDDSGVITRIHTENYAFIFPEKKRPDKDTGIQEGDALRFNCQGEGGTPLEPLVTIYKPGLEKPIYSEIVAMGCICSTVH